MQVHAVPESERVFDSTGRKLPWGFDFADSDHAQRRIPEEKGPFGKARKRGTSRSKTATPARGSKEDQANLENLRVIDDIFSREKLQEEKRESLRVRNPSNPSTLPLSASTPNLIETAGLSASFQASASNITAKEPTEVLLYGYGNEVQWAAIDYYEKVSGGLIYEEYDRQPPSARYNLTLSQQKASSYRSLSKGSLRKINEYVGGEHWIKITFDSPEAAERACHYSPHVIQGFKVFAERFRGLPPAEDKALRASAGSWTSQTASPNTVSSQTLPLGTSSTTLSSATATGSTPGLPPRYPSEPIFRTTGGFPEDDDGDTLIPTQASQAPATTSSAQPARETGHSKLRIKGAKAAILLPSEKAFLPAAPRWQQTFGSFPVIGWVIGSNHGIIGDQVPRKEDGSFDSASASLYWRLWYAVDSCFGTDFCGVKEAEYEE